MDTREAYLFYEAGQAVAAAHLRLRIWRVSGNPTAAPTHIVIPRNNPKARLILWLAGMAAERKGAGHSHPLRRTRNRARVRSLLDATIDGLPGSRARRIAARRVMLSRAQDRANALCNQLYPAIEAVAARLRTGETLTGPDIAAAVDAVKHPARR